MIRRRIAFATAAFLAAIAALGTPSAGAPGMALTTAGDRTSGTATSGLPAPATAMAPAPSDAELLRAYLPKDDLGVTRFLADHPQADGRGVLVAVLDTGIDLHHPGLLHTPSGERKIVDVYDATDNGLIDLPISVISRDTVFTGWTGRTLRLGPHRAEDGNYRLGRLPAREILPRSMTGRVRDTHGEEPRQLRHPEADRALRTR
ncbi:MAG: hypothetical protein ABH877_04545 [bacterium]